MIDGLVGRLADGAVAGPLLGFLIGAVLGLSPVALPTLPVVVGTVSPGRIGGGGERLSPSLRRMFPSILAFTVGMNGVISVAGYAFVSVAVAVARAAVALHLIAATVMGMLGLRLLLRKTSLCKRAAAIPPDPRAAFVFGVMFSVGGCPGCAPISIGLGTAAATVGGPGYGLLIIGAFILGHAAVLMVAAGLGGRLLPSGTAEVPWLRLDRVVGVMFVTASLYYVYRLLIGGVATTLPGEPGSGLLP